MTRVLTFFRLATRLAVVTVPLAALLYASPVLAATATAPSLGTASDFAALGGTGVTCTSPIPPLPAFTISGGDVGSRSLAPTTVTGFPGFTPGANRCSLSGAVRLGATAAFNDFQKAYAAINTANPCPADAAHNLSGNLGGLILLPGVYCFSGVATLTSQLTLSGGPNDVWIFKGESITPINGSVVMTGAGSGCNVYWRLGSTAVFDGKTHFVGNVLAGTAITFTGVGSSLTGRALATSDVTLTGANITGCTANSGGNGGGGDGDNSGNGGGDDHQGNGGGDDHQANGDGGDHNADGDNKDHHGDMGGDNHHGHHGSQDE